MKDKPLWSALPAFFPAGAALWYMSQEKYLYMGVSLVITFLYLSIVGGMWEGSFDAVRAWVRSIMPHLKSATSSGTTHASGAMTQAKDSSMNFLKKSPMLAIAVVCMLFGAFKFWKAYTGQDWQEFHLGLLFITCSILLFVIHFEWYEAIWKAASKNMTVVWAAASAITLAVTLGHALILGDKWWYYAGWSLLSLICSFITLGKGWGEVGGALGSIFDYATAPLYKKGLTSAAISWAIVSAVVATGLYFKGMITGLDEDLFAETASIYAIFIFLMFVAIGYPIFMSIHKAKNGK